MVVDMKLIAITAENYVFHEPEKIQMIIDSGFDYVHIRKPSWGINELDDFIAQLPSSYHCKLKLHSHFKLLDKYNLAGIHLNKHYPNPTCADGIYSITKSCHSISELIDIANYEYVFLSPIFNSISKEGYDSTFELSKLKEEFRVKNIERKVIALGGVSPDKLTSINSTGFAGAAFLGYLFNDNVNIEEFKQRLEIIIEYRKCYSL